MREDWLYSFEGRPCIREVADHAEVTTFDDDGNLTLREYRVLTPDRPATSSDFLLIATPVGPDNPEPLIRLRDMATELRISQNVEELTSILARLDYAVNLFDEQPAGKPALMAIVEDLRQLRVDIERQLGSLQGQDIN